MRGLEDVLERVVKAYRDKTPLIHFARLELVNQDFATAVHRYYWGRVKDVCVNISFDPDRCAFTLLVNNMRVYQRSIDSILCKFCNASTMAIKLNSMAFDFQRLESPVSSCVSLGASLILAQMMRSLFGSPTAAQAESRIGTDLSRLLSDCYEPWSLPGIEQLCRNRLGTHGCDGLTKCSSCQHHVERSDGLGCRKSYTFQTRAYLRKLIEHIQSFMSVGKGGQLSQSMRLAHLEVWFNGLPLDDAYGLTQLGAILPFRSLHTIKFSCLDTYQSIGNWSTLNAFFGAATGVCFKQLRQLEWCLTSEQFDLSPLPDKAPLLESLVLSAACDVCCIRRGSLVPMLKGFASRSEELVRRLSVVIITTSVGTDQPRRCSKHVSSDSLPTLREKLLTECREQFGGQVRQQTDKHADCMSWNMIIAPADTHFKATVGIM